MSVETNPDNCTERDPGLVSNYLLEKIKYSIRNYIPPFNIEGELPNEHFTYQYQDNGLASSDFIEFIYREGQIHNSFFLRLTFSDEILNHRIIRVESSLVKYLLFPDGVEVVKEENYDSDKDQNTLSLWRVYRLLKKGEKLFNPKGLFTSENKPTIL